MISARDQRELVRRLAAVLPGAEWSVACTAISQMVADQAWDAAVRRGELPHGEVPPWIVRSVRERRPRKRGRAAKIQKCAMVTAKSPSRKLEK